MLRTCLILFFLTVITAPWPSPVDAAADICQAFRQPCEPRVFELPSAALPAWHDARQSDTTLVLMSLHPFLVPLQPQQLTEIHAALQNSRAESLFAQRGTLRHHNPLLAPVQALSAALKLGFFSKVIWVIPRKPQESDFDLVLLRKQLATAGFFTTKEAKQLQKRGSRVTGLVRGVPITMVHPDDLPQLKGPVILHLDLSYFKGLYKNEIATPLYDLLHEQALSIKKRGWPLHLVTLSYSTYEEQLSVDVRFLVHDFAALLKAPQLLEKMPKLWQQRSQALHVGNMFQETKARNLFIALADIDANDAQAWYERSRTQFQKGQARAAFASLDKAVALDHGYAIEYLLLADRGASRGAVPKAISLLEKAQAAFPSDPFIVLRKAELLQQSGHPELARPLLVQLQKKPWSKIFYPNMPSELKHRIEQLSADTTTKDAP
ncbi:MAG: hypothetical protein D6681_13260 [Calditrichaeota bacterium]|nr:MAG: hypothetical protein D6681_13260 [Calditrichota bacterium]